MNRFEHFDAAYCVNSFYVSQAAVARAIREMEPTETRYEVTLGFRGNPPCRYAKVEVPDARKTILPRIANDVLVQREADVVVQAVGRVRPFTRPREIITFQVGDLPGWNTRWSSPRWSRPATTSASTAGQADLADRRRRALALQGEGQSPESIAAQVGVSARTVRRYVN